MPKGSLRDACSPARLTRLAGRPSYERGERYAAERRVTLLAVDDDAAIATVARNDRSAEAIELPAELHGLLAPAGHEEAHTELVAEVRHAHRRKRNLIRMLDAQEWPAPCR